MGSYPSNWTEREINTDARKMEDVRMDYASKFGVDLHALEAEYQLQMDKGDLLIQESQGLFDRLRTRWKGRYFNGLPAFRALCSHASVSDAHHDPHIVFHSYISDDSARRYLQKLRRRNLKSYKKIAIHLEQTRLLVRAHDGLHDMTYAHLFLSQTPRAAFFPSRIQEA